jgi:hypothetical protein
MIGAYQTLKTARFARDREAFPTWLISELRDRGVNVAKVTPESYGWSLKLRNSDFGLRIECGSRNEALTEWGAYVVADASILERMFRRIPVTKEIERVTAVLEKALQAGS